MKFVRKSVYSTSLENRLFFPTFAWRILYVFLLGCLNFQSFGGAWSGRLLQSQIQSVLRSTFIKSPSLQQQLMQTPFRSSSVDSSVFGLLGGDLGLSLGVSLREEATDTLAEDWLLSRCASLRRRRYSSPELNGKGVTLSGVWLLVGWALSSTHDSPSMSSLVDFGVDVIVTCTSTDHHNSRKRTDRQPYANYA